MDNSHPVIKNPILNELLPPKRIVFIVNPVAGVQQQQSVAESIDRHLNHRRFIYTIRLTEKPGHAAELAKEAVAEGYDIVVAVGGDGSINEVASSLRNTPVVLGIVPAGSGNGLAMHLGYGREIDQAIQKINTAVERTIDCGTLNGRPFFNLAGIGFDGLVTHRMKTKQNRSFFSYLFTSVGTGLFYSPRACTIELDDRIVEETCLAISIANGPMYGYNVQIAPDAQVDDGMFSVVVLKKAPKWQYVAAVPATLQGRIYDADFVDHFKSKRVRIRCEGKNYVHLDGEGLVIEGDLNFEIQPKALHILVPHP